MEKYRIQRRKYSSNVLEKKIMDGNKERWVVFIAPTQKKSLGDIECDRLFNFYMNESKKTH